jgi:hypothetical protein
VRVRDSRRVQPPDYSAPASRLGFIDELTFLSVHASLPLTYHPVPDIA